MLCFPNCKINLGLYITRRRDDGYHDIETVFFPLSTQPFSDERAPLRDVLEIVPAAKTEMHISGLPVAGSHTDNLVWKAYELLASAMPGRIPPSAIYLHKAIPMGAGLGGGSADGAFMLQLLNDNYNLGLSKQELAVFALKLGSDCPFFIYNTPQFATGRGEQMTAVPVDLSGYSIQVVCPDVHVSTAGAFKLITPKPAPFDLRNLHTLPVEEWKDMIGNDFEAPVFAQHPVLADIKTQLYAQGAVYVSMSGTGSAVFGIFPKGKRAEVKVGVSIADFQAGT